MIYDLNANSDWRKLTTQSVPDINMKDIEILLRGFAMLIEGADYKPSLTKFINGFSREAKKYPQENIEYLKDLFIAFLAVCQPIGDKLFVTRTGRFNISVFESIFTACCDDAFKAKNIKIKNLVSEKVDILKSDDDFTEATQSNTASTANVKMRLERAKKLLF